MLPWPPAVGGSTTLRIDKSRTTSHYPWFDRLTTGGRNLLLCSSKFRPYILVVAQKKHKISPGREGTLGGDGES